MNLTLTEAAKTFLDHCRLAKCLSNHMLRAYEGALGQFAGFVRGETMVGKIDRDQLRAFARFLFDQEKLKETSVRRKLATLKVMFRWLESEGHRDHPLPSIADADPFRGGHAGQFPFPDHAGQPTSWRR